MYPLPINAVRECASAVGPGVPKAIASAYNKLAFDLYKTHAETGKENFVLATPDVLQTLAMISAGASGNTLDAALKDTRTGLDASLHLAMNAAVLDLAKRNQATRFEINSAIWGQGKSAVSNNSSYLFSSLFLNKIVRKYGARMATVDFTDTTTKTISIIDSNRNFGTQLKELANPSIITAINQWILGASKNDIKQIISDLPERPRLVTANTVSLNGAWRIPPDATLSGKGRFQPFEGEPISTPMLGFTGKIPYTEGRNYRAFQLPLADSDLALTVLMPNSGAFAKFNASLSIDKLNSIAAAMRPQQKSVFLPKFKLGNDSSWSNVAAKLKASGAFDEGSADFSRLNGEGFLYLDGADGHAVVSFGESGLKASAASIITQRADKVESRIVWDVTYGSGFYNGTFNGFSTIKLCEDIPHYDPDLVQARPFILAVRDLKSGSILFMGKVTNPGGKSMPPDWITSTCDVSPANIKP